jgi:hypothetical protein
MDEMAEGMRYHKVGRARSRRLAGKRKTLAARDNGQF